MLRAVLRGTLWVRVRVRVRAVLRGTLWVRVRVRAVLRGAPWGDITRFAVPRTMSMFRCRHWSGWYESRMQPCTCLLIKSLATAPTTTRLCYP